MAQQLKEIGSILPRRVDFFPRAWHQARKRRRARSYATRTAKVRPGCGRRP